MEFPDCCLLVVVCCMFVQVSSFSTGNLQLSSGQVERVCKCCEVILHQLCGSQVHLVGMKPVGWSISQRHIVETAINLFSDWSCLPIMRLVVSNMDRFSPDKVARECSMSAVDLAFHFYVTPSWLLGQKKNIQCWPGLMSKEQFSRTTLWLKSGASRNVSKILSTSPSPLSLRRPRLMLTKRLDSPFDWGWYGGDRMWLTALTFQNSLNSCEVNCVLLSLTNVSGTPCWAQHLRSVATVCRDVMLDTEITSGCFE